MVFSPPLVPVRFLRRYKRFFADIELPNGEVAVAHVPNTGSMKGLIDSAATVGPNSIFDSKLGTTFEALVSQNDDPKRKLKYTLEALKSGNHWVGVHTGRTGHLVQEIFNEKQLPEWKTYTHWHNEIKISAETRLDGLMVNESSEMVKKPTPELIWNKSFRGHFIEIKNVTLAENQVAMFPDAVSARALKHLDELKKLVDHGHQSTLVFTVQRNDCTSFSPASLIDKKYGAGLKIAHDHGVNMIALEFNVSHEGIEFSKRRLPIVFT